MAATSAAPVSVSLSLSAFSGAPLVVVAGARQAPQPRAQQAAQQRSSRRRQGGRSWQPISAVRLLAPGLRPRSRSACKQHARGKSATALTVLAQNAEDLNRQLHGLRQEREDTLNKVQALDRRCERLTNAMMELYNAAARLMGEGQETAARARLEERAALSTALERARSRRELYSQLAQKVAQAISAKETLLISALAAKEPTKAFQQPPPAARVVEQDDRAPAASSSGSLSEVGGWMSDEDLSNRFLEMERSILERMMNNVLERASTSDTHPEVPQTNQMQLSEAMAAVSEDITLASRKVDLLKDQLAAMKADKADAESIALLENRLAKAKVVLAELEAMKTRLRMEQLGDQGHEVVPEPVPEPSSTVVDAGILEQAALAVRAGDKSTAISLVQKFVHQGAETSDALKPADAKALYRLVVEAILGSQSTQGLQITRDSLKGLQKACGLDKTVMGAVESTAYRRGVLAHNIGRGAFPNMDAARTVLGLSREQIESAEAQASELSGLHSAVLGLLGLQETDSKEWQRVLSAVQTSETDNSVMQWVMSKAAQTVCYELVQQLLREKGTAQVRARKLKELLSVPTSLATGLQVLGREMSEEDVVTQCSLLGGLSAVQASALYESFLEVNFLLQQEPDTKHISTLLAILALPKGLLHASHMAVQTSAARHVMRDCRMEPDGWARLDKFGSRLGLSASEAASAAQVASGEQASALSKKLLAGRLRGSTISDEELRFLANVCSDLRVVDMPLPDQLKTMLFKRTLDVTLKLPRVCDSAQELDAAITASSDLLTIMTTALELPQSEYQLSAAADAAAESALLQGKASLQRGDQQLATLDVCRLALALALHPKPGAAPRVPSREDAKLMVSFVAPDRFGDAPCMQTVRQKLCRYLYLTPDQLPVF